MGRSNEDDDLRFKMKKLTRSERLIFILHDYEEMTFEEIGLTLDLSEEEVLRMHTSIITRLAS